MCIQNSLQSKIAELTNDGDILVRFLTDTVRGAIPGAKHCHRIDAAKTLTRYGSLQQGSGTQFSSLSVEQAQIESQQDENPVHPVSSVHPEPRPELVEGLVEEPTLRDIVAYPVARYIRSRTNDGETLLEALTDIMRGGSHSRFEYEFNAPPSVKPNQRLAAAKEIMSRAFGESRPARAPSSVPVFTRPALTGSEKLAEARKAELVLDHGDPINERFAQLVRDRTNNGIDAAETMIRIVENDTYEDDWLPAHRLTAARELIHRAYDLNYDAVTWEHVDAYRRATQDDEAYKRVDLDRKRQDARMLEIIAEFDRARDSDDEEAMKTAERKYANFVRYGDSPDPDEPIDYAGAGPSDPDPTAEYNNPPRGKAHQAKFDRQVAQRHARDSKDTGNSAAAAIATPTLAIPLHNRSP